MKIPDTGGAGMDTRSLHAGPGFFAPVDHCLCCIGGWLERWVGLSCVPALKGRYQK